MLSFPFQGAAEHGIGSATSGYGRPTGRREGPAGFMPPPGCVKLTAWSAHRRIRQLPGPAWAGGETADLMLRRHPLVNALGVGVLRQEDLHLAI